MDEYTALAPACSIIVRIADSAVNGQVDLNLAHNALQRRDAAES